MVKFLTAILIVVATLGYSQEKKAVVFYKVISATPQDSSYGSVMSAALLQKSKLTFSFFKNKKARVELKAGSFFSFQTVYDYKKGVFVKLMGHRDDKKADVGEIKTLENRANYTLVDDTMTIHGYKCYKAIYNSPYGELVCWYTKELGHNFQKIEFLDIDVPGLPLKFTTVSGGVTILFEVTKVEKLSKEQKKLLSTRVPEGYVIRGEEKEEEPKEAE